MPDGSTAEVEAVTISLYDRWGNRFHGVLESIAVSVFTTLKYYATQPELFSCGSDSGPDAGPRSRAYADSLRILDRQGGTRRYKLTAVYTIDPRTVRLQSLPAIHGPGAAPGEPIHDSDAGTYAEETSGMRNSRIFRPAGRRPRTDVGRDAPRGPDDQHGSSATALPGARRRAFSIRRTGGSQATTRETVWERRMARFQFFLSCDRSCAARDTRSRRVATGTCRTLRGLRPDLAVHLTECLRLASGTQTSGRGAFWRDRWGKPLYTLRSTGLPSRPRSSRCCRFRFRRSSTDAAPLFSYKNVPRSRSFAGPVGRVVGPDVRRR